MPRVLTTEVFMEPLGSLVASVFAPLCVWAVSHDDNRNRARCCTLCLGRLCRKTLDSKKRTGDRTVPCGELVEIEQEDESTVW